MNKKRMLMLIIGSILLISIIVGIGVSGILTPYERQIRLGYKLLEQGNYEEAILAFDKAIEIDVRRDKAYIGKADVYVARCDENTLEDMKAVLEIAYNQHYNDDNIVQAFVRLADDLIAKDKTKWAIELLNFGYELTQDERINEHKIALINKFAGLILADLYVMFENNEEENIKKEIQSEKYVEFMTFVTDWGYKYIYFPEENETQTGTGIALYYVGSPTYGNVFVYYGGYENGLRFGNGKWVGALDQKFYWFDGVWASDKPNGYGDVKEWNENLEEGMTIRNLKGNLANGVWHGDMNWNFIYPDRTHENTLPFSNGNATPIEVKYDDNHSSPYHVAKSLDSADGIWFDIDPSVNKFGVIGFDDVSHKE